MKPFRMTVAYELFEFIEQQTRSDRATLKKNLISLGESPHRGKDLTERSESGRDHFVHLSGKFAVKYWIDEWEREVKIIDIQPRDRRN